MTQPTKKQIKKLQDEILLKKIKEEAWLRVIFKAWQQDVYSSFIIQKRHGASIVKVDSKLRSDLAQLLREHYYDVVEDFVPGTNMDSVKQSIGGDPIGGSNSEQESDYIDTLIPAVLLSIERSMSDLIDMTLPVRVDSIVNTTEQIGNQSSIIAASDPYATYSAVLANKLAAKTTTVSITETTWVAESSMGTAMTHTTPILPQANIDQLKDLQNISPNVTLKNIDATELLLGSSAVRLGVMSQLTHPKKTWISVGDKKVRASHVMATGITLRINEAFILPGGMLMYPTDSSLGASIAEIINCRCWAMYF